MSTGDAGNTADSANTDEATWHYAAGHYKENGEDWYDVREVYPPGGYTQDGVEAISESLDGLEEVLGMMLTDIGRFPVVEVDSPSTNADDDWRDWLLDLAREK